MSEGGRGGSQGGAEDAVGRRAPSDPDGPRPLDDRCIAELREILESAPDPILMGGASGAIVLANRALHDLCGYAPGALIGLPLGAVIPERLHQEYRVARVGLLRGEVAGSPGRRREYTLLRRDGAEVPVEAGLAIVRGAAGPLVLAFIHDATERKATERRIREYQGRLVDMAFDATIAEERERRRIAADLHDHVGQSLAVAQIKIAWSRGAVTGEARAALDDALGLIEQTIADMRTLLFDLSPPVLYDLGLTAALAWLGETIEQKHGIRVVLDARDESSGLDPDVAALLFRTVRELLMNVVKHARTTVAAVTLRTDAESIHITVRDQGVGFDPAGPRASGRGTFGLFSARERVRRLGGTFEVRSAPGAGTLVRVRVPRTTIDDDDQGGLT